MKLEPAELEWCAIDPWALRAIADHHDYLESQADAMGASSSAEYHRARRIELHAEANRLEEGLTGPITRVADLSKVTSNDTGEKHE